MRNFHAERVILYLACQAGKLCKFKQIILIRLLTNFETNFEKFLPRRHNNITLTRREELRLFLWLGQFPCLAGWGQVVGGFGGRDDGVAELRLEFVTCYLRIVKSE